MKITVGQALLLLIHHCQEDKKKVSILTRAYLGRKEHPSRCQPYLKNDLLTGYEIIGHQQKKQNTTRRYFESQLAYHLLESHLPKLRLKSLNELLKRLTTESRSKEATTYLYHEYQQYITQIKEKEIFKEFPDNEREKVLTLLKLLYLSTVILSPRQLKESSHPKSMAYLFSMKTHNEKVDISFITSLIAIGILHDPNTHLSDYLNSIHLHYLKISIIFYKQNQKLVEETAISTSAYYYMRLKQKFIAELANLTNEEEPLRGISKEQLIETIQQSITSAKPGSYLTSWLNPFQREKKFIYETLKKILAKMEDGNIKQALVEMKIAQDIIKKRYNTPSVSSNLLDKVANDINQYVLINASSIPV